MDKHRETAWAAVDHLSDFGKATIGYEAVDIIRNKVATALATVERETEQRVRRECAARIKQLEKEVVFGFYEEEYPLFVQGYEKGVHELSSPVTADECTGYIEKIKQLKNQLIAKDVELKKLSNGLLEAESARISTLSDIEQTLHLVELDQQEVIAPLRGFALVDALNRGEVRLNRDLKPVYTRAVKTGR